MKAIFTGSLSAGFRISQVVEDDQAEDIVVRMLSDGRIAEAVTIDAPDSLDKNWLNDSSGDNYIVFNSGVGNGISVIGPFEEHGTAIAYGETMQGDDDDWELFTVNPAAAVPKP